MMWFIVVICLVGQNTCRTVGSCHGRFIFSILERIGLLHLNNEFEQNPVPSIACEKHREGEWELD